MDNKSIWYNYNNLLSCNCLFNFLIGIRGGGKSYGAKKKAVKDFIASRDLDNRTYKTGKRTQFIYVRRYKTELKKLSTFFDDIRHEFPNEELHVKGRTFYCGDEVMGYAVALSTSGIEKSNSYPDVKMIIFDEFIITTNGTQRYLQNEVLSFLEFYETVDRKRDETRVIFIGNAITSVNPYFVYFKIQPDGRKQITKIGDLYAIELYRNDEFKKLKEQTRFGRIIKGTQYGDYAMENDFYEDNEHFIEKKSNNAFFEFSVVYNSVTYGFWLDVNEGKLYMSEKHDASTKLVFALTSSDHRPNYYLIKGSNKNFALKKIKHAYQYAYLYFETQTIKKVGEDIIKMIY